MPRDSTCRCDFEIYYDYRMNLYDCDSCDEPIEVPLKSIIDLDTYTELEGTLYSKDRSRVYAFFGNSDGGNRVIVSRADPATFKPLCEYRWGTDKYHVFYETDTLAGLDLKHLQILYYPDTSENHFVDYVKDEKLVFYQYHLLEGADAKTFKVLKGEEADAMDKNYKYKFGARTK
jgi:hypothetical protein